MNIVIGCRYVTSEMAKEQFGKDIKYVPGDERGAFALEDRKLQPAKNMLRNIAKHTNEAPENSSFHFLMCFDDFTLKTEKGIRRVIQRAEDTLRSGAYSNATFEWFRFDFTSRNWIRHTR